MNKISRTLITTFFVAFVLTGCAQGDSEQTAASQQATPQQSHVATNPIDSVEGYTPAPTANSSIIASPTRLAAPLPTATVVPSATPSTPIPDPTATSSAAPSPSSTLVPEVVAYLEEAYAIMQENSIRQDAINWDRFYSRYEAKIAEIRPQTIADAHAVIREAVQWLGDNHSQFFSSDEVDTWLEDHQVQEAWFHARLVEDAYGYIAVPTFSSGSDSSNNEFATVLQTVIAEVELAQPCGWIIDLRMNYGGNMWPMIVGVGPILGEGKFGENIRADGNTITWRYEDGQGWWGDELLAQTNAQPVVLHTEFPPTVVLLGELTTSAGEAVAIAFKGRPNTRFLGTPTAGFTTAPEPYYLRDGSIIFLSDSYMGDRDGNAYRSNVSPDEQVRLGNSFAEPIAWLAAQPPCS